MPVDVVMEGGETPKPATNRSVLRPARIAPVDEPTPEAQRLLDQSLSRNGHPLAIFRTLAKNPELFKQFNRLGGYLLTHGLLSEREREPVILWVGWRCGSAYEFGQHILSGIASRLTETHINQLATSDLAGWDTNDRDLVVMVDELCADNVVSDGSWRLLTRRSGEAQLIGLLLLFGYYRLVLGFLNGVGVQLDGGNPGWP